jgi:uncharacterized DUF497 family protein
LDAWLEKSRAAGYVWRVSERIEWGPKKAASNFAKHGVSFEAASTVFFDPLALTIPDPEHSFNQDRFITMGLSVNDQLLVVVHTDQAGGIWLISAREATPRE